MKIGFNTKCFILFAFWLLISINNKAYCQSYKGNWNHAAKFKEGGTISFRTKDGDVYTPHVYRSAYQAYVYEDYETKKTKLYFSGDYKSLIDFQSLCSFLISDEEKEEKRFKGVIPVAYQGLTNGFILQLRYMFHSYWTTYYTTPSYKLIAGQLIELDDGIHKESHSDSFDLVVYLDKELQPKENVRLPSQCNGGILSGRNSWLFVPNARYKNGELDDFEINHVCPLICYDYYCNEKWRLYLPKDVFLHKFYGEDSDGMLWFDGVELIKGYIGKANPLIGVIDKQTGKHCLMYFPCDYNSPPDCEFYIDNRKYYVNRMETSLSKFKTLYKTLDEFKYKSLNEGERTCEVTYKSKVVNPNICNFPSSVKMQKGKTSGDSIIYRVEKIGKGILENDKYITDVSIPENVKIIGESAFANSNCKRVFLPNSLQRIEKDAFKNTNLESLTLPRWLMSIDIGALEFKSIGWFGSEAELPPTVNWDKKNKSRFENLCLHVPKGCKKAYKKSEFWRNFKIIDDIVLK